MPVAPDFPSGLEANAPWRLPGAGGGGTATGWIPSAIRRSPLAEALPVEGGGGTTAELKADREAGPPWAERVETASSAGGGGTTAAFPAFKVLGTR